MADYNDYENIGNWAAPVGSGLGAILGSVIPGVGTAIGGAAGGALGGGVGSWARGQALQGRQSQMNDAIAARANELYGAMDPQIAKAASQASEGSAAGYARRGLARSGMGSAAQGNITQEAGRQRAQARLQAHGQAQQEIMGQYGPLQQQAYQQYGQAQGYQQGYMTDLERLLGKREELAHGPRGPFGEQLAPPPPGYRDQWANPYGYGGQ